MPRKQQNGFGASTAFKPFNMRIDKGKGQPAAGLYPTYRGYGSSVNRTIIEKYDLDSSWTRWRRGMEYFYKAAWLRIYETTADGQLVYDEDGKPVPLELNSILYQGTGADMKVKFDGWRFATTNADSRNHYVVKRTNEDAQGLGQIVEVYNDPLKYPDNKKRGEIWARLSGGAKILRNMLSERVTDSFTEASILFVLNKDQHPAVYRGKSWADNLTTVKVTVPMTEILTSKFLEDHNGDLQSLVGEIGYVKNFFQERNITDEEFIDGKDFFAVAANESAVNQEFEILDVNTPLPPSLYDIATLPKLFATNNADYNLEGRYVFQKSNYQRFFGRQYLTAEVVESEVQTLSFTVMPFTINSVRVVGDKLEITSIPFEGEMQLYSPVIDGYLIFSDSSFTTTSLDTYDNEYYHHDSPGQKPWRRLDIEVDPWMDEIFFNPFEEIRAAEVYCCSCPDYTHSIIRMPDTHKTDGTTRNRQQKYPLPSVMSRDDFQALGLNKAAGIVSTWADYKYQTTFRLCKHTVAAMFIDRLKLQEPNTYPTLEARESFEKKLAIDMETAYENFINSLERSELTMVEVVYALAQGLNLDDVESAYVVLNTTY